MFFVCFVLFVGFFCGFFYCCVFLLLFFFLGGGGFEGVISKTLFVLFFFVFLGGGVLQFDGLLQNKGRTCQNGTVIL